MKLTILLIFFNMAVVFAGASTEQPKKMIHGNDLRIILLALPEFEKKGLDVLKYNIEIHETKVSYVVFFRDPNLPTDYFGSGDLPQFEVEISKADQKILRANYVK